MTNQDLADLFCKFSKELLDSKSLNKTIDFSNLPSNTFERILFSRLYYALYHKVHHHAPEDLKRIEGSGKHLIFKDFIKDPNVKRLYEKLYYLRVWADYKLEEKAFKDSILNTLQNQVYKVLQSSSIKISK